MSQIFCISGPSGAGKSSLMERTVELLDHAVSFSFDAYQSSLEYPEDLFERLSRGDMVDPRENILKDIADVRVNGLLPTESLAQQLKQYIRLNS